MLSINFGNGVPIQTKQLEFLSARKQMVWVNNLREGVDKRDAQPFLKLRRIQMKN